MADHAQMVRRQQVLADFGEFALRSDSLDEVLTEACRLIGEALESDLAKVLELQEDGGCALLRAGIGWKPGLIGHLRLALSERSSEAYALNEGKPIITTDLHREGRFGFPDFMVEAGVIACVNVPIFLPGGKAYGLLQVDAREPREFGEEDIQFLRTYGTILGPVIDRLLKVHELQVALDANKHLLLELQHRVKNHIGIIASFLRLRAKATTSETAREELTVVEERVETLRLVHEQLYAAKDAKHLKLEPYIRQILGNLERMHEQQSGEIHFHFDIVPEAEWGPDTILPLGLILNEFVTNSLKYAFDSQGGVIAIKLEALEHNVFRLQISDNGKGLPSQPQAAKPGSGTGMRLIEGLARQIDAKPNWSTAGVKGTSLRLEFTPR